jgi:hypothetical protein
METSRETREHSTASYSMTWELVVECSDVKSMTEDVNKVQPRYKAKSFLQTSHFSTSLQQHTTSLSIGCLVLISILEGGIKIGSSRFESCVRIDAPPPCFPPNHPADVYPPKSHPATKHVTNTYGRRHARKGLSYLPSSPFLPN